MQLIVSGGFFFSREQGTPEQPPHTPRARGARGEGTPEHGRQTLSITNYQLPITNYQLPITNYQLPITNYQLPN
jgi:hypothetical protein